MKKKTKKVRSIKSLQNKAEALAKECCLLRDGKECQVKVNFPNIQIAHSDVYQADHCFSRQIKELFLDLANLTTICSTCNAAKGSNRIGVTKRDAITVAVHEIVKIREGIDTYNRLLEVASRKCAFIEWRNRVWLENQINILTGIKKQLEPK